MHKNDSSISCHRTFNSAERGFIMRRFIYLALSICAFCSSALAGPKEDAFQVVDQWAKAFTAADVDTIVGLYAQDAVFMGTGTKEIVTQPEGVKKYFEVTLLGRRKFVQRCLCEAERTRVWREHQGAAQLTRECLQRVLGGHRSRRALKS
jgi:hypothetical protein